MTDPSVCRAVAALVLVAAGISSALAQTAQPLITALQGFEPAPDELMTEEGDFPNFGLAVAIRGNLAVAPMFRSATESRLVILGRDTSGIWQRVAAFDTPTGFNLTGHSLALGESRIFLGVATTEIQVFVRSGNGWVFEQEFFTPGQSDPVTPNLAFDQGWLAVNTRGSCCTARVSLFSRRNGTWSVVQTLEGQQDENFGRDFAIEAGTLVVSAGDGVHIYRLQSNGVWVQRQLITPPSGAAGFGSSVAIGNGLIAIGAPDAQRLDPPICGTSGASGAVYVYVPSGPSWVLRQVVSHRFADCHFRFGSDVAITSTHLAVKSELVFTDYHVIDGKIALYRRTPAGTFSIVGRDRGDLSTALALSPTTMMVGVPRDEISPGGRVSVYELADVAP